MSTPDPTRDQIEATEATEGYKLIVARILDTIERKRNELEQLAPPEHANYTRGEIHGLRTALKIAAILKDEYDEGVRRGKR